MIDRLTRRQFEVLSFLRETIARAGYAPTVREIAGHFSFSSHTSAEKHLAALEKKGLIRRRSGLARTIELVGADDVDMPQGEAAGKSIPVLGRVPAGEPILAVENFEGFLSLEECFGDLTALFALQVKGDSMTNVGIDDGDFAVVRLQEHVSGGDIAVAYVGEDCEATVKRVFFKRKGVVLQPENEAYEVTLVPKGDPYFRIAGRVVGVVKRF